VDQLCSTEHFKTSNRCVALWPCHLHLKVSKGKRRIMETQIFHSPCKNIIFKKILWKKPKSFKMLL
jgi:hypothetical protein